MTRRTCACGTPIMCADLDGLPVWLDEQPGPDGMLSVRRHGDSLDAVADGTGPYRRHTCAADPEQIDLESALEPHIDARTADLSDWNRDRLRTAAERSVAAARAVLDAGCPLSPLEFTAAVARLRYPHASGAELGAITGHRADSIHSALGRIRNLAERITSTGETAS